MTYYMVTFPGMGPDAVKKHGAFTHSVETFTDKSEAQWVASKYPASYAATVVPVPPDYFK